MSAHNEPQRTAAELTPTTKIKSLLLETQILQGRIEGLRACARPELHFDGADLEREVVIEEERERLREEVGRLRREVDGFGDERGEGSGLERLRERVGGLVGMVEGW